MGKASGSTGSTEQVLFPLPQPLLTPKQRRRTEALSPKDNGTAVYVPHWDGRLGRLVNSTVLTRASVRLALTHHRGPHFPAVPRPGVLLVPNSNRRTPHPTPVRGRAVLIVDTIMPDSESRLVAVVSTLWIQAGEEPEGLERDCTWCVGHEPTYRRKAA